MKKLFTVFILSFILVLFGAWGASSITAQNLSNAERAKLQSEYDALQKEIAEWQKVLDETKLKKNTLQGDVSILNAQIEQATKEIKQRTGKVALLNDEIKQKTATINSLETRINNDKILLANLLKKKDQNEVEPIFYLLMSSDDLSEMMTSVDNISTINKGLQDLFAELRDRQAVTEKAKNDLSVKKDQELDAQYEIELKKKQIAQNQTEKKQLLDFTARAESNYQQVLADRQRKAEAIRNALFNLRDTQGISFSQALEYAKFGSEKTGVRPAMILAILSQESDLGKNLGSCTIYDLASGKSQGVNTGRVFSQGIHPTRDLPVLSEILDELNRNPLTTRVSCPLITELGGNLFKETGYGGAMGPSQFIPSTWKLYIPGLKSIFGTYPDPWNAKHAITATALLMRDNGAGTATFTAERNAACKYYSGRVCDSRTPANTFYGNSVITKAAKFQEDIDFLDNL